MWLLLLFLNISARDVVQGVIDQQNFVNWIARAIYDVANIIPRIKKSHTLGSTTFEVTSFSDVAVNFLLADTIKTDDIFQLCLSYCVSIIGIAIPTALFFLAVLFIGFWWCILQCIGSKPVEGKKPSPCTACRDHTRKKTQCFCRICFLILSIFLLFGIVLAAVGGILLNNSVKGTFNNCTGTVNWFLDAVDKLEAISNMGETFLNMTGGVGDFLTESGAGVVSEELMRINEAIDEALSIQTTLNAINNNGGGSRGSFFPVAPPSSWSNFKGNITAALAAYDASMAEPDDVIAQTSRGNKECFREGFESFCESDRKKHDNYEREEDQLKKKKKKCIASERKGRKDVRSYSSFNELTSFLPSELTSSSSSSSSSSFSSSTSTSTSSSSSLFFSSSPPSVPPNMHPRTSHTPNNATNTTSVTDSTLRLREVCQQVRTTLLPLYNSIFTFFTSLSAFHTNAMAEVGDSEAKIRQSLALLDEKVASIQTDVDGTDLAVVVTKLQELDSLLPNAESTQQSNKEAWEGAKEEAKALMLAMNEFLVEVDDLRSKDGEMCGLFRQGENEGESEANGEGGFDGYFGSGYDSAYSAFSSPYSSSSSYSSSYSSSSSSSSSSFSSSSHLLSAQPTWYATSLSAIEIAANNTSKSYSLSLINSKLCTPDPVFIGASGASSLSAELRFADAALDELTDATVAIDSLFFEAEDTLFRAKNYLADFGGFINEYLKIYKGYGDVIFYSLAAFLGVYSLIVISTVPCTFCNSVDSLLCCSIFFQFVFLFIVAVVAVALAVLGIGLMDTYNDLYRGKDLVKFYPIFDFIVDLTKPANKTEPAAAVAAVTEAMMEMKMAMEMETAIGERNGMNGFLLEESICANSVGDSLRSSSSASSSFPSFSEASLLDSLSASSTQSPHTSQSQPQSHSQTQSYTSSSSPHQSSSSSSISSSSSPSSSSSSSSPHPNSFDAPTYDEFLPFALLNGSAIGNFYLRHKDGEQNPVETTFIKGMNNTFMNLVNKMKNPQTFLVDREPRQAMRNHLNDLGTTSMNALSTFNSVVMNIINQETVTATLYAFLNAIFISISHNLTFIWAALLIILASSLPSLCILMCGRDLWKKETEAEKKKRMRMERRQKRKEEREKKGVVDVGGGGGGGGGRKKEKKGSRNSTANGRDGGSRGNSMSSMNNMRYNEMMALGAYGGGVGVGVGGGGGMGINGMNGMGMNGMGGLNYDAVMSAQMMQNYPMYARSAYEY
ncbi:uncharacterized protein MONOS_3383 [Monocercomonoides exilis]|uniref:uncharacterized protein n=1 Tax=Monocercomonoides exilis TaxID=2049356 RepID=UPI003559F6BE|nr:hypothetical protein MONOS_3383 [Monocercomonoides exilis]|eukprot:MONOS_3383.1-p1 / transcript=MONOS_3383.1 / gene=MONOS_3383 / organism=Monocercomonoides_exilis_PA203 / gene_product=unspecified product / transcript_product=unspecified product / location=Mono_scaffold00079:86917-91508(-) / protein_length=1236 / sequence_SO=supercontig / SO=protein_coding / is_pseudo=false